MMLMPRWSDMYFTLVMFAFTTLYFSTPLMRVP